MDDRISALLDDLRQAAELNGPARQRSRKRAAWLAELTPSQVLAFLDQLSVAMPLPLARPADELLAQWLAAAAQARRAVQGQAVPPLRDVSELSRVVPPLYRGLSAEFPARGRLLAWLAAGGSAAELELWGQLLVEDPPAEEQDVLVAMAPVVQQHRTRAGMLFPKLLRGLAMPSLAAPVLDLANFLTREGLVPKHPASGCSSELAHLLGEVAQSLLLLEEQPLQEGPAVRVASRRVAQGVALAVALCDALAQIGDRQAIGKLYQALRVRHRRLRTEAAAALARLGEEQGASELVQLAAYPVSRLRVLQYARELGLADRIDPQYTTLQAQAEAELCVWLAEPTQFGIPPSSCELVDHRRLHWPGYREPRDCYLFRFQYVLTVEGEGERSYSNIGIAGPLVHAFIADLGDLPAEDIYAAFAGWHAQHPEIRETDVAQLPLSQQLDVERLKRRLHDSGYEAIQPQRLGYFFGEKVLIATVRREQTPGVAVVDGREVVFFPQRHSRRPLGVEECYSIYKGRKLLKAFNATSR
jgi:hypothetical protein